MSTQGQHDTPVTRLAVTSAHGDLHSSIQRGGIMSKGITMAVAILVSLAATPHAHAATINVNCGGHEGYTSVNAAIRALAGYDTRGADVINVRGVCNENVVFKGVSHITLDGGNNATIVDLSGGATPAILLDSSQEIAINNLTASGTGQGSGGSDVIDCQNGSICRFNNVTVENGSQNGGGIGVWTGSYMYVNGGAAQNNKGWAGIAAANGGRATIFGMVSRGNWEGAAAFNQGGLVFVNVSLTGNAARGMQVYSGASATCDGCTISGNGTTTGGDGVDVQVSSSVSLVAQTTVTGNGGAGVSLTNLSSLLLFGVGTSVKGNLGAADVVCNPSYTTATLNNAQVGTVSGCP
jgi:hypothetical protein